MDHPTQKPMSISLRIVKHFSNINDLVVIPFAGSGSECLAALMENRHFLGFELNLSYIEIAQKRILDWKKQKELTSNSEENLDNLLS